MNDATPSVARCSYQIESRVKYRGKVWWRRRCLRLVTPPETRCWQHRLPAPTSRYDSPPEDQ